jgi:hypothetical protein
VGREYLGVGDNRGSSGASTGLTGECPGYAFSQVW